MKNMKSSKLVLGLAVAATIVVLARPAYAETTADNWKLTWSDEFNGDKINSSNWTYDIGGYGWGNNELQYYTNRSENSRVEDGNLIIEARKESYSGSQYTSARLKSQGLQNFIYGKIEARIKLPEGQGLWPAFWMLGSNMSSVGWPDSGELDIMEHINFSEDICGTAHWNAHDGAQYKSYGGQTKVDVTKYHNYSIEWSPNYIKWFVDGNQYAEYDITNNVNGTESYHKPFFLILNMAVGGNWPKNPDASTQFPAKMYVDYVRVYNDSSSNIKARNLWFKDESTGYWSYLNAEGKMQTGWLYDSGNWYYFYGNGQMATGFINLGEGYYYYLDESNTSSIGIMRTGWKKIGGYWFYFNTSSDNGITGSMKRGWHKIGGNWYYFYSDGKMAANTTIDGYYVNSNGAWS